MANRLIGGEGEEETGRNRKRIKRKYYKNVLLTGKDPSHALG
ncbi:MAG: hypothetical protein PT957_05420 [Firmicutes bacterium]|nr:hypothetical protein [Bacillota bacterium]